MEPESIKMDTVFKEKVSWIRKELSVGTDTGTAEFLVQFARP